MQVRAFERYILLIIIFKMLCTHLVLIMLKMVFILHIGAVSEIGITFCVRETPKWVLLQTVKTQI